MFDANHRRFYDERTTDPTIGGNSSGGDAMGVTYFKRYRMEIALADVQPPSSEIAPGYSLRPWSDGLLDAHAEAKYFSFCYELDANVFPCLGEREGCRRLMREISQRQNFVAEATWLLTYQGPADSLVENCGTVQGLQDANGMGAIQNLGVTDRHRGRSLGTRLLLHALVGFRRRGMSHAFLEVTAQNEAAVRLYERLGFRRVKTVYKVAQVSYV